MRSVFIFATLFAVAFSTSCYYGSTSEDFYDLSKVGSNNWISGTDNNNNVWNINVCVEIEEVEEEKFMKRDDNTMPTQIPTCPANSSVCVQQDQVFVNRGTDSSAIFSDSPNGASSGVEVIYSAEGECTTQDGVAASIKTVVEYNCVFDDEESVSIVTDGCFTTINVFSPYACPQNYYDSDDVVYVHTPFFAFFGLVLMAVACTCLCCCCCMRRRRIQKRNIAMRQFSNVAFQPIPASQMKSTVQQPQIINQNLPAYNPYVQPQFLYYYPSQQQQVQQQPIQFQQPQMVELDQMDGDEKLAKQLQAQFDRESQV